MNVPNGGTPTIGGATILTTSNVSYPTVNNPAITFQRNSSTIGTVNLNQSGAQTINFTDSNDNTVTSIRQNNTGTYRTGNINLVNGSNITVTETATGTFTIATSANVAASGGNVIYDIINADEIRANHIVAGAITARELSISNNASGSAGIYFSTTAMEIHDGTRVRVKIGAL